MVNVIMHVVTMLLVLKLMSSVMVQEMIIFVPNVISRQGDSIYPYLFVLGIAKLSRLSLHVS